MRIERMMLDIQERLAPLAALGVEVEIMPSVQADFDRVPPNDGRLSILFFEAKPKGDIRSAARMVQDMDVTFHVMIQASKMQDKFGISDLHARAKKLLVGFKPTDCTNQLSHGGLMFSRYLSSVWEYALILNTATVLVEDYEEFPDVPGVSQISVESPYTTSVVTS